jgi:hypothetical protein
MHVVQVGERPAVAERARDVAGGRGGGVVDRASGRLLLSTLQLEQSLSFVAHTVLSGKHPPAIESGQLSLDASQRLLQTRLTNITQRWFRAFGTTVIARNATTQMQSSPITTNQLRTFFFFFCVHSFAFNVLCGVSLL